LGAGKVIEVKMHVDCFEWFSKLDDVELKLKIENMFSVLKERYDAGDHVPRSRWKNIPMYRDFNNLWV
jgi:hypothetical protein